MNNLSNTTICAISTAPGIGGIAVIRISGIEAISIANRIFLPQNQGYTLADTPTGKVRFGRINQENGSLLDEVVITLFALLTLSRGKTLSKYLATARYIYNKSYCVSCCAMVA